jgi:hypothetical protein
MASPANLASKQAYSADTDTDTMASALGSLYSSKGGAWTRKSWAIARILLRYFLIHLLLCLELRTTT